MIKPKKAFTSFIEGIRIPLSACPSKVAEKNIADQWLFEDVDIANLDPVLERLKLSKPNNWTPVLVWSGVSPADFDWKKEMELVGIVDKYLSAVVKLKAAGCNTIVLSADEDGLLHQLLSPRFDIKISLKERIEVVVMILSLFSSHGVLAGVSLTVEELCPGGTDATDGIEIGCALEKAGAQFIISNSGTKDFPALKYRRPTKLKAMDSMPRLGLELSSGMWLNENLSIPVIAQGFELSKTKSGKQAEALGFAGVVDRL